MSEIGVSLCMTMKNEAHVLDRLAADLRAQTVKPDEIVVTDGGSTDGPLERLRGALGIEGAVRSTALGCLGFRQSGSASLP